MVLVLVFRWIGEEVTGPSSFFFFFFLSERMTRPSCVLLFWSDCSRGKQITYHAVFFLPFLFFVVEGETTRPSICFFPKDMVRRCQQDIGTSTDGFRVSRWREGGNMACPP